MSKWINTTVKCILAAVVGVALGIGLIEGSLPFFGPAWHLFHKQPFVVAGRAFEIPSGYFVNRNEGVGYLEHFSPILPFVHRESGLTGSFARVNLIIFDEKGIKNFNGSRDFERVRDFLVRHERGTGVELEATRVFDAPAGKVYCYQFKGGEQATIRCMFDLSSLTAYFTGETKHAHDVFSILEKGRFVDPAAAN